MGTYCSLIPNQSLLGEAKLPIPQKGKEIFLQLGKSKECLNVSSCQVVEESSCGLDPVYCEDQHILHTPLSSWES